MKNKKWMKENMKQEVTAYTEVDHTTINFVDNSSSIVSLKESDQMNYYLDKYMEILKIYYNKMKFKIYSVKTTLMIICSKFTEQCIN